MPRILTFLLALSILGSPSWGAGLTLVYPPPESAGDERHLYYWQLLDAALASNRDQYGAYSLQAYPTAMTFQRGVAEVESGNGRVNIVARATNIELERRLRPIRIPLDKGLLGTRLFLVMPPTLARLTKVRTLADLQKFTIGQSPAWSDARILEAAGFSLVLSDHYDSLFTMLGAGRFDLFSRGVIEIDSELRAKGGAVPGMMIDPNFALQYPLPRYYFVPRTAEGERMAERIEDGLLRLRRSGEFERRYQAWKRLVLKDVNLGGRTVFRLANPQLGAETPLADKFWWDDLASELASR